MSLRLDVFSGAEVAPFIPELARLRMAVFREWPYLYEGSLEYEEHYLAKFLEWPESTLVVVRDGERVVGASTALPLAQAEAEFQEPFVKAGLNPAEWYYFGESVLEAAYRGQGLGVAFFRHREARALQFGYRLVTFCAVDARPTTPSSLPTTNRWMLSGSGGGFLSAQTWFVSFPGRIWASPRRPPNRWSSGSRRSNTKCINLAIVSQFGLQEKHRRNRKNLISPDEKRPDTHKVIHSKHGVIHRVIHRPRPGIFC